jgi:hypothetical protein
MPAKQKTMLYKLNDGDGVAEHAGFIWVILPHYEVSGRRLFHLSFQSSLALSDDHNSILQMSGSTLFNLSLLTSDMWAVAIRVFLYQQQVTISN